MKIGDLTAHIISIVLQPLLMTFYSVALLFLYTSFNIIYSVQILNFFFPVLLFTFLIPSVFIFLLKKLKMVKDYALSERQDRILPYLMTCFAHIMLFYFYYKADVNLWFLGILAAPVIIIAIAFIINIFWKISAHMMGIGGLIGSTMSVCYNIKGSNPFILFAVLFILAGILAVSRLYLKRDSALQVYTGFFLGFLVAYFTVFVSAIYIYR